MQMYNGMTNRQRAQVLVEALPYIQKYNGKIVVVKYGGNAMINEELKHDVMRDMVLMSLIGVKMVLVHGGGPEISSMLKRVGKETEFVNGLRVTDEETGNELVIDNKYVMSPKDLCTIPVLDQLLDAGVSVLKLEGRGRSSDYVRTVTSVYREAARACQDGTFSSDRAEAWMKRLESVFNRGFWQGGYYLGVKWGEWSGSANSRAALLKIHIARVENFYKKNGVAALFLEAGGLSVGQTILIAGPTTGAVRMEVAAMRRESAEGMESVEAAQKGETVYLAVPEQVRRRDKVYLLRPRMLEDA